MKAKISNAIFKKIPLLLGCMLIAAIAFSAHGYFSILIMRTVDSAISNDITQTKSYIVLMLGAIAVSVIFETLLGIANAYYLKSVNLAVRENYIQRLFKKSIKSFDKENNASYISGLTNDVVRIEDDFAMGVTQLVYSFMRLIVSIIVLTVVSPWIFVLGIGITVVMLLINILLNPILSKKQEERSELFAGYSAYIKEVLSAFHIIKVSGLDKKVRENFTLKSTNIQFKGYDIDKTITIIGAVQQTLTMASILGIFLAAIYMTIKGYVTIGGIVLVLNNIDSLINPVFQVVEWAPKILATKGIFKRIDKILNEEETIAETIEVKAFNETLELKDVEFSYDEQKVFEGVNLSFKPGEKHLVVGPSGGGKSTLLKLLRKYTNPSEGTIKIDNYPLDQVTKQSYFTQLANIEQNVFIFEDTLKNNITMYQNYSEHKLKEAIAKAGLDDFINTHEGGLDYMILDNGKNISGGERSRIAIARALLRDARILLIDEAFASLDDTIARQIEDTLLSLKDILVINVSHVVFEESKERYNAMHMVAGGTIS